MSYFKHIVLLKAPLVYDVPQPQYVSDLIEICQLAAMIEHDVESITIPVDFYSDAAFDDFNRYLGNNPVDLVGISSITGAFNNALKLAEIAKKSGKYVVMGGYHPSALPREVLKSPFVDGVIIGEGEVTFRELVLNGPSRDIAGLALKLEGKVVFTAERELIEDLDSLPLPLRNIRPSRFGEPGDDSTNSRDEIKNYLLTYLESSCGEYNRETPRKNSFLLKTYKKFTMRFFKSPDESIDLQIVPYQDTYKLFIERPEKGTEPAGFFLDFETIIKLGERLTNNKLVAIASKFEIANSYTSLPYRRFRKNLGLAFDQDILVTSANLVRYLFPVIIKGLLTMSLQAMKPKEQMPEKTGTG